MRCAPTASCGFSIATASCNTVLSPLIRGHDQMQFEIQILKRRKIRGVARISRGVRTESGTKLVWSY